MPTKFLFFAFLFFSVSLRAQQSNFTIIGSHGKVLVNGKAINDFSQVLATDKITIAESAYLALIHSDGHFIELNKKSEHIAKELVDSLSEEPLFEMEELATLLDNAKASKAWGVDIRAKRCFCFGLIAFSGNGENILLFGDRWLLNWDFFNYKKAPQSLAFSSLMDDILLEKKVINNAVYEGSWDKSWNDLPSNSILVNISQNVEGGNSLSTCIRKVPQHRFPSLVAFSQKAESTQSPLAKLALAIKLEANKFPMDAYFAYQDLLNAYPEVTAYQYLFKAFSERQLIIITSK